MLFFVFCVDIFSSQMACKFVEVKDNGYLKIGKSSFHPAVRLLIRTPMTTCHPSCARSLTVAESSPSRVIFHSTFEQLSYECLPYNELSEIWLPVASKHNSFFFFFDIAHTPQDIIVLDTS